MPEAGIAIATGGSWDIGRNAVLGLAERGVRSISTCNTIRQKATPSPMATDFGGGMRV